MSINKVLKQNIKKSIIRCRKAGLNTTVVLLACCYIDGLGKIFFNGGSEYRFKKYIETLMPKTLKELKERSLKLRKKEDFCLHALWRDVRCGLVHEIDPKSKSVILGRGRDIIHQNIEDKRFEGKDLVISSPRFIDDFLNSLLK